MAWSLDTRYLFYLQTLHLAHAQYIVLLMLMFNCQLQIPS